MIQPRSCILLVEDNADDAAIAVRALNEQVTSHEVVVVNDGAEARDFLNGVGAYSHRYVCDPPDLVLLDVKLPKLDGLEVLRGMRGEKRTRGVPVVVLSSSDEVSDVTRAYAVGANSYIRKPVDYDTFARTVRDVCRYWLTVNLPPPKPSEEPPRAERPLG